MTYKFHKVQQPPVPQGTTPTPPPPTGEGQIHTLDQWATGSETYINNPANNAFYLDKIDRSLVYGNYPWYDGGWQYADLVAIYNNAYPGQAASTPGQSNPFYDAMILRDGSSNRLFIPFGAIVAGQYAQYAADPGLAAWRTDYASRLTTALLPGKGHVGIMQDDVNPGSVANTVNGAGTHVDPIDPRTGSPMTGANWSKYHAEFIEANKVAVGTHELVSNMHWYAGNNGFTRGFTDTFIARIILASDFMLLENGLVGMTGDNDIPWTFSFQALREYADFCHTNNTALAWFTYSHIDREYELAMYFLLNDGNDYIGVTLVSANPATYNTMYDIDLGQGTSARFQTSIGGVQVWRRNFTGGIILVNGPGMPTASGSLGGTYRNTSGALVTTISLAAQRGAVLRNP